MCLGARNFSVLGAAAVYLYYLVRIALGIALSLLSPQNINLADNRVITKFYHLGTVRAA
jgi:hypothetical protein